VFRILLLAKVFPLLSMDDQVVEKVVELRYILVSSEPGSSMVLTLTVSYVYPFLVSPSIPLIGTARLAFSIFLPPPKASSC
jgi:hypothetical protein